MLYSMQWARVWMIPAAQGIFRDARITMFFVEFVAAPTGAAEVAKRP
ncbi:hypothetical protein MSTE_04282 [Mycobacteroides stephanolepidis]|uniref:Uncharacterized protein n=1 Tax=[Mycobacterium] stephanolepidis TaxID=1520670 RepID=A0A1Z4F2Y6_9MYCO|nr:hypothetical protein MSTE_04282 [[Mycobacterium] stephanolepidis]